MINKILNFFGLMKIARARSLSRTLHLYYIKCVSKSAKEDFKCEIPPDLLSKGSKWWAESFEEMISTNLDRVTLTAKKADIERG